MVFLSQFQVKFSDDNSLRGKKEKSDRVAIYERDLGTKLVIVFIEKTAEKMIT